MAGVPFSSIAENKRPSVTPKQDAEAASVADKTTASDLTPARYPDAISHNSTAHDALQSHIDEIRSRLNSVADKQSKNSEYIGVKSTVDRHLAEAETHLNNSRGAHKAGGVLSDLVRSGHTAVNSFGRAATHVADALNHMSGEAGFGPRLARDSRTGEPVTSPAGGFQFERENRSRVGNVILSDKDRTSKLVTHNDLNNLTNNYQSHVRSSLDKRGVSIPKGVADAPPVKFSPTDEPSTLARESLGKAGVPLTRQEEILSKAKLSGKVAKSPAQMDREARAKAMQSGNTFTAGSTGKRLSENAYKGVGITGFNELQAAVRAHWQNTNSGHAFIGSPAHKDPVGYAKRFNVSLPDAKTSVGKTLERMGEKKISAGKVLDPERDRDPSQGKAAIKLAKAAAPTPETAPMATPMKESRSGAFSAANGGK